MKHTGVRRLVCISALGVGDSKGHGGFVFDRMFQPLLLGQAYKDKERQEAAIKASSRSIGSSSVQHSSPNQPARGSVRALTDLDRLARGQDSSRRRRELRGGATDD